MIKDKYVQMYNELIKHLHRHAEVIRILALITPLKLKKILGAVKTTIKKTNPDYD